MSPKGKPPTDYGPVQLAEHALLPHWVFGRARTQGLLPDPDVDGSRWSAEAAAGIAARAEEIHSVIGSEPPIGAARAAARVGDRYGLEVERADIDTAAEHGHLVPVDDYKGHPLYDCRDLDALDPAVLELIVAERLAWLASSLARGEAADQLGWTVEELVRVTRERGIAFGRFGRYARTDIDTLAADRELDENVRRARLLGPDQAACHLEIRRTDFDYAVAAGWITPASHVDSRVSRRRSIVVPLYATGDVDDLRDLPGIDWELVRAAKPGEPSPLREFTTLPTSRAALVRGFAADLGDQHGTTVTACYDDTRDQWELFWTPGEDGEPSRDTIRAALRKDRDLAPHNRSITLRPATKETP